MLAHRFIIPACQIFLIMFFKDGGNMQQARDVKMNYIDTRYLQTLNIKPVAGRLYSDEYYAEDTVGNNRIK